VGFALLGVSHRLACRGLHRNSSYVLGSPTDGGHSSRVHQRVSIAKRLSRSVAGSGPLLGFRTFPSPSVQIHDNPGYVFSSPDACHY
jgi:hypothetical protein